MSRVTQWMDRVWYQDHAQNWDDLLFRERILSHIKPDSVVLDLGAGGSEYVPDALPQQYNE